MAFDWDDIRFFLAVARNGTASQAARKLGVDHSTVMRRIDSLERSPSVTLFERMLRSLIRAWQLAVPQMGIGDTIEIALPATLGYGPLGRGPIPGGATLLFKIELLAIPSQ